MIFLCEFKFVKCDVKVIENVNLIFKRVTNLFHARTILKITVLCCKNF